jgi:hypothetical protein
VNVGSAFLSNSGATLTTGGGIISGGNLLTSSTTAALGWSTRTVLLEPADGELQIAPNAGTTGVRLNVNTADTLIVKSFAGGAGNLTAAGTITFAGLASSTGVRYVCASTTGVLDGQAAACIGTEQTMAQYAKDGYVVLTRDEYADFQAMRAQFRQNWVR